MYLTLANLIFISGGCSPASNGRFDAAARIQIDNRQLEIGNEFTLPPLASNELFGVVAESRIWRHGELSGGTVQSQPNASRNADPFGL
jgi:hypothetical protein